MMSRFILVLLLISGYCINAQSGKDSIAVEVLLKKAADLQSGLNYSDAYKTLMEALHTAQNADQKALEFKTRIAIGDLQIMKGEEKLAEDFFETRFPDKSFPVQIKSYYYHRKAFYFDQQIKLDSALANAKKGVKIAEKAGLTADLITLYNEMGYIYERQRKFALSEEYYDKVLDLAKKDLQTYSNTYLNKARMYLKTKRYRQSIQMLKDNLSQIDTTKWYQTKVYIYDILAQNYKALGDSTNYYKSLYHHHDEMLKIQNVYSETQYKDLLLKYQTAQKDELLSAEKAERKKLNYLIFGLLVLIGIAIFLYFFIKRKNQNLNRLLKRNQFLLSELNHRIKNNLQLIVSFTARETNKTETKEITGLVNLASKIDSIASLHKQLYLTDEQKSVKLKPYLEEIISSISPFLEPNDIQLQTEIEEAEINSNTALYIGLIINELMVNSIKHAFEKSADKRIHLIIKLFEKNLEIYYSDNGTGVKDHQKVKLVNMLSRQIEARYEMENQSGFYYHAKIKI